ncbi:MAG: hypothetical protein U0798_05825 [Gemmataceae bacterium]
MLTLDGKKYLLVHATPRDPLDEYTTNDPDVDPALPGSTSTMSSWGTPTCNFNCRFRQNDHRQSRRGRPATRW